MPDQREPTAAELASTIAKETAEAAKFEAEGQAATLNAIANSNFLNQQAEEVAIRLRKARHDADREDEKRRDELAGHKYHHMYTFDGVVSDSTVAKCIEQLTRWERSAEPGKSLTIDLEINSPGGEIFAGFALIDHIGAMHTRGHTVNTAAIGMAASMGGVILQVGKTRLMGKHAFLLIHEASFRAGGSFANVQDEVELVEKMHDKILDLFASRSKMTRAQIKRRWSRKDWWLTSDESLKYGFVDEVI